MIEMGVSSSLFSLDDFFAVMVTTAKPVVKVYCMSDIHADTKANSEYLSHIQKPTEECFSVFICNGDLCTDIPNLVASFKILKATYDEVCYVPGNHELWRRGSREEGGVKQGNITYARDSVSKFNEVIRCARQCGIRTGSEC